jgi:hypothetical protein
MYCLPHNYQPGMGQRSMRSTRPKPHPQRLTGNCAWYAGLTVKCPHCNTGIAEALTTVQIASYPFCTLRDGTNVPGVIWIGLHQRCSECHEVFIYLEKIHTATTAKERHPGYPSSSKTARPIPAEITDPFRQDFAEACTVLPLSPKASAALSRRLLQFILREKGQTKKKDFADQIDEVIDSKAVPSHIAEDLHAVRVIGNFAAHPIKSKNTGEIVDVEPGEAEWNLDVVESLFDFYFVQPELSRKRKEALNKKLTEAGKPTV